jgi:murein L,D-transpeptidase YafK
MSQNPESKNRDRCLRHPSDTARVVLPPSTSSRAHRAVPGLIGTLLALRSATSPEGSAPCVSRKMRYLKFMFIVLATLLSTAQGEEIDSVLVIKSKSKMFLISKGVRVKEYSIALGGNPKGSKQQEGDEKTPEGKYFLDYKKSDSAFYKAIHISYPNEKDKARAKAKQINPGGLIMIHGQKNGLGWLSWLSQKFNWTNGCIAVSNAEMDEIWRLVKVGTPIEIQP